jgi:hypothetical protein
MKRWILSAAGLGVITLFAGGLAWGAGQGGPDDSGNGPDGLVFGDANKPSGYVATAALELRDIPNVGGGQLSNIGARFLRVTARFDDGDAFKIVSFDYQCGEPAIADPCSFETICTLGKGNKENCVLGQVVDVRKTGEIQAVVVSLLIPQIVAAYGLDPSTTLENTKLKGYVQTTFPVRDVDGVASFYSVGDLAFAE